MPVRSFLMIVFIATSFFGSCQNKKVTTTIATAPGSYTTPFKATVTMIAGDSLQRGAINDADPLKARFLNPKKLLWDDRNGSLYIADGSGASGIRKIDASGSVTTPVPYVGTSNEIHDLALAPDGAGTLYFGTTLGQLEKSTDAGTLLPLINWRRQNAARKEGNEVGSLDVAAISGPNGMAVTSDGTIYFSNSWYKTIHKINLRAVGNEVTEFAGKPTTGVTAPAHAFADGAGSSATFGEISDMAADDKGVVYVADGGYCTVRKITPSGTVSSFLTPSSNVFNYYRNRDGAISTARSGSVHHVCVSRDGSLVFFTTYGTLRVIRRDKDVSTLTWFRQGINGIAATPDGKTIYVTSGYAIFKVSIQ